MLLALWVFVLGGRDVTSECVFFTNLVDDEDLCFSMAEDNNVRCAMCRFDGKKLYIFIHIFRIRFYDWQPYSGIRYNVLAYSYYILLGVLFW